jgi:Tfp pilus assembly protein PilN
MEKKEYQTKAGRSVLLLTLIILITVAVNGLFLFLSYSASRSIRLLETQQEQLEQEQTVLNASEQLYQDFQDEIATVANVFPNEETIPQFIQSLEGLIRGYTDAYSVKFNSLTPLSEQDKLYLIMTITMNTDLDRFTQFLGGLETYPYMTHVTSVTAKTPDGYGNVAEYSITLKVYVQNPFTPA